MKVKVIRKEHFNAAHRLFNARWNQEKNFEVFGKCSNPNYHGHNYELEISLIGEIDPETGYVYDLKKLSDLVNTFVIQLFDHKNLNLDVPYFKNINPTAENIAVVIWEILRPHIDNQYELKIKLYETERNCVEYPAY